MVFVNDQTDPDTIIENYSIFPIDADIYTPVGKRVIRDYTIHCVIKEEPKPAYRDNNVFYYKEIELSREYVERLKERLNEMKKELSEMNPMNLEGMQDKVGLEQRIKKLEQNLKVIDDYFKSMGYTFEENARDRRYFSNE